MIGSITEEVGGSNSTPETRANAKRQCVLAISQAIKCGARIILFGASTKRLISSQELKTLFPKTSFTIGDNLTGLFLQRRIEDAMFKHDIKPESSTVLILAPYGHLGKIALQHVKMIGFSEIIGFGSQRNDRKRLMQSLQKTFGITISNSLSDVKEVDLVIAGNGSEEFSLSPHLTNLRKFGKDLVVIDPCEPPNLHGKKLPDKVYCYDAGNGYSNALSFFPFYANVFLRLNHHELWGCFAETLVIAKHHDEVNHLNWLSILPENAKELRRYVKAGDFISPPL